MMSVTWKANKGPAASGGMQCTVKLLDGTDIVLDVGKKTEGQVLFEQIVRRLEITQKEYFGLEYEDENKFSQWLDLAKPLRKQVKRTPYRVSFKVRYYPLDPMTSRSSSRTQFYQQARRDIIEGKLRIPDQFAPGLIAFIVQADLGDYESLDADIEYMSDKRLVSNEDITLQEEISRSHKLLRGTNAQESVSGFLRKVRDLDNYGMVYYDVKYKEGACRMGISPKGLSLYQRSLRLAVYDWLEVMEISFKGKKLTITVKDNEEAEKQVILERDSSKSTKELWSVCAESANFYSTSSHRTREEPTSVTDLCSPGAATGGRDIFGYPTDSLDDPTNVKVRKSKSLPRNLPSDDPVLVAAMAHRAANQQDTGPSDSSCLGNEPLPSSNSMQLILPDMPQIANHGKMSPQRNHGQMQGSTQPHAERDRGSHDPANRSHVPGHNDMSHDQGHRSHDPHHELRVDELKSGSTSRLSKSSRSTSNLSQDDDIGSLLDLADELGDEEEEVIEEQEVRELEWQRAETTHENIRGKLSPRELPKQTSQTLPQNFNSPKHSLSQRHHSSTDTQSSPQKYDPRREESAPQRHGSSPYRENSAPKRHGSSPYKNHSAPQRQDSSPHKHRSSHTSGREHKKEKDGKSLVKMWVQEQQLRMFQSGHSQESTSSSSIGANLDHLEPSPELKPSYLHATPPSPRSPQHLQSTRPSPPTLKSPSHPTPPTRAPLTPTHPSQPPLEQQGPPKPPRNYYPTSSELYDHIGNHSMTLPSPRRARHMQDTAPKQGALKPESPLMQYKSSEHIHSSAQKNNGVSVSEKPSRTPDPLHEIDDLMKDLNVDSFFNPKPSISPSKPANSQSNSSMGEQVDSAAGYSRRASDSTIEQARHDRRASERKLRKSQKLVNQLISENREDDVFTHDISPSAWEHTQVDTAPDLEAPPAHGQKDTLPTQLEKRSSLEFDKSRFSPSSDGPNLRNILQEVMESNTQPRPPAHLAALSQDMEDLINQRTTDDSPYLSTSPQPLPSSSLSSFSKSSSKQASSDRFDFEGPERKDLESFRPPSATAKLPPAIASFMSRVRNKTPDTADSSLSDGPISPVSDPPYSGPKNGARLSVRTSESVDSEQQRHSPLVSVPPTYDSPRLVRMEMSATKAPAERPLKQEENTSSPTRKWMDDDNHLHAKVETSLLNSNASSPTPQISSSATTSSYNSELAGTITTSSDTAYDTPRAIRKQLPTSVVYPEHRVAGKTASFSEGDKSKGVTRYAQRNAEPSQHLQHSWNYFDNPETKQIGPQNLQRRSTEPYTSTAHRLPPSPSTPLTPMSAHTHSDLGAQAFTYPTQFSTATAPQPSHGLHTSTRSQQPYLTTQGYSTRPDTGQSVHFNQANPRSRNYKPQSQAYSGGDIRRAQTFSLGRESGWSQGDRRNTTSPSDDSLPNSPTYFIENNPNIDRDTPSPATQAQNASFQEHLQQLGGKGSRKMRVLNWMQQSSTDSLQKPVTSSQDRAHLRKDSNTSMPSKHYQKQAPVYASIDDLDDQEPVQSGRQTAPGDYRVSQRPGSGSQRPGSGSRHESRQREFEAQREMEKQRQKLSSHPATAYDMEQRQRATTTSTRPYSRHGVDLRQADASAKRQTAPQLVDSRPGSGTQRRAQTFSYGHGQPPGPPRGQGAAPNPPTSRTGQANDPTGYPTKYAGKDYYVIDV